MYCRRLQKAIDIKFSSTAIQVHVTNLAEDRAVKPGPVMNPADTPGNARVTIGITAIQGVSVIEVNGIGQGLFR